MLRFILVFLLFLILIIFQTTFLVYFPIFGMVPNLIFAFVMLFAFFEAAPDTNSFWYAAMGGVFLDLFSSNFLGFWTLILLFIVFLIKFFVKSYVRPPIFQG